MKNRKRIFKQLLGQNRARPTRTVRARPAAARPQRRNAWSGSRGHRPSWRGPVACSRGPQASEAGPAQRPLGALERTERATTVERTRRAAPTVQPVTSGYGTSHGKVFTVSTQDARRTCLTWPRTPARSEEGVRRRGRSSPTWSTTPELNGGEDVT
jgi:hypothetical protein